MPPPRAHAWGALDNVDLVRWRAGHDDVVNRWACNCTRWVVVAGVRAGPWPAPNRKGWGLRPLWPARTLIGRHPSRQLHLQAVQLIGVRCPAYAFSSPSNERYRKAMPSYYARMKGVAAVLDKARNSSAAFKDPACPTPPIHQERGAGRRMRRWRGAAQGVGGRQWPRRLHRAHGRAGGSFGLAGGLLVVAEVRTTPRSPPHPARARHARHERRGCVHFARARRSRSATVA
jgi:hypothetical protein